MVPYFGDFALNATVYIPINTFDSNDPAASVTVTNLLNTDVHIHKNGGTTQRNNAAGITMSIDYDSITGNHLLTIDTSDNTVADFYQAGYEYQVRVEGITVDGGTLNAWVGCFSIERSGGALALLKNATYGLSAIETLVDDLEGRLTAARAGYLDSLNTGVTLADDAITAAKFDESTAFPLKYADTGADKIMRTGADSDTGETLSDQMDALATAAELAKVPKSDSNVTWNATAAATIQSECNDALVAIHLDHLLAEDYDPSSKPGTATALLNELVENDGGVSRFTENALEQAPSGTGASAASIADAVWDEALSGHTGSGSAGEALAAAGDPWTTALPGSYGAGTAGKILGDNLNATVSSRATQTSVDTIDDFLDTEVAAILADTNELQTDLTNGGRLDLLIDAIKAKTDNLPASPSSVTAQQVWEYATRVLTANTNLNDPTAAAIADAVWDEASTGHTDAGKAGAQLWTDIDAIIEDTGTTLDALIKDVPTVAEFEARTIAAADYVVVSDTIAGVTTVGTTTNLTNLPNIPANWLTAAGLAADAVAEIQSGLSTLTAQQVWEYATRVLTANTNLSILDAAGIRTAVGLASANLDTQLDALPTAAEIKTALEASNSSLDYLMRAIVYKNILTFTGENEGNLEMFNAAGGSIGTVIDAFTEDATTKIRAKLVPA